MNLCKYRDIFGKPNEGVHSYRFLNFAVVDTIVTIIGAYFISKFFKFNLFYVLFVLFLIGIIFHKIFCVNTTLNKYLFNKM